MIGRTANSRDLFGLAKVASCPTLFMESFRLQICIEKRTFVEFMM